MGTRVLRNLRWFASLALIGVLAVRGISTVHQPGDLIAQPIVIAGDPLTATISFTGRPVNYTLSTNTSLADYSGYMSGSSGTVTIPTNASAPGGTATLCLETDGASSVCRNITVEK